MNIDQIPVTVTQSAQLSEILLTNKLTVATAESCTGGGVAHALTSIPGCSAWFELGMVTYSNRMKECFLGVKPSLLSEFGAVSEAVVEAMLAGLLEQSQANIGVAVSGIAGPGGGTLEKPVGTVCFAWGGSVTRVQEKAVAFGVEASLGSSSLMRPSSKSTTCFFTGDRAEVRSKAVDVALSGLLEMAEQLRVEKNTV